MAAEDTRRTRGLLQHLGAESRLLSFHAHSPARRTELLLEILLDGRDVALVTDAGTPGISDPGPELVAAVRQAGVTVVPIPGAAAVITALSASGLPADRHLFLGFVPRKGRERARLLGLAADSEFTVVCYEAANRLIDLLRDLVGSAGAERQAVVARELTKLHEEIRAGTLEQLAAYYEEHPPRGEVTIVLAGRGPAPATEVSAEDATRLARRLLEGGLSRKAAAQELARTAGMSRNEAYRIVMELP